jgi:hypothetical protein
VDYGVALVILQRVERLMQLDQSSHKEDLLTVMHNSGHSNWNPTVLNVCEDMR